jgi:DNA-binding response OmpR family regulator
LNSPGNSGSGQQQKRILIIDDEEDVTLALGTALEQNGFKSDSYTDPVLAYKKFKEDLYDLVLLDIRMPVIDGFLLYQKIKGTDSKVKICFLTATEYFHEEIRKR